MADRQRYLLKINGAPDRAALREIIEQLAGHIDPTCGRCGSSRASGARLCAPGGESIERQIESSALQYDEMQARWRQRFGVATPLTHRQRSKWQAADLHDREVRVMTRSGRTFLWDLGRGVDGVMGTRFGCRVNITELLD